ncbi:MAG: hypothetical protein Q8M54_10470, partial [Desulfobaccales bacterium]|nr:hypothetical protein [Desulfobaccales bacterium]
MSIKASCSFHKGLPTIAYLKANIILMRRQFVIFVFLSINCMMVDAEEKIELKAITVTGQQDDVSTRRDAATQKVIIERKEIESLGVSTIG